MLYAESCSKSFGAHDVLTDVSFSLGDGDHAGLVGPNGGGKSTILRMLSGEMKPDEGTVGYRGGALGYLRQEGGSNPTTHSWKSSGSHFPKRAQSNWNSKRSRTRSAPARVTSMN